MWNLIVENLGTVIVGAVLVSIVTVIVAVMVLNKKKGKSSCSCGCSGCPLSGKCGKK